MTKSAMGHEGLHVVAYFKALDRTMSLGGKYGAGDTEPRGHRDQALACAMKGKPVLIPQGADAWELYSNAKGREKFADILTRRLRKLTAMASTLNEADRRAILHYYGWDWDWNGTDREWEY